MKKIMLSFVAILFVATFVFSFGEGKSADASTERYVGSTWKYRIDNASAAKAKHVHFYKKVNGGWVHQLCAYGNGDLCDANKNKLAGFSSLPSKVKKAAIADKSTGMSNLCACSGGGFGGGGADRPFIMAPVFALVSLFDSDIFLKELMIS